MLVKNKATGKEYNWSRGEWNSLGKNQKLFTVLDESEAPAPQHVTIKNIVTALAERPDTGEQKNSKRIKRPRTNK